MSALWIVYVAVIVFYLVSMWRVFEKAGQPGWAAIVPLYNFYILLKVAGKPGLWLILMFIPLVNVVVDIIVQISVAEKFGQSGGFAVGLIFLPFIFYPILAFGEANYGD